MDSHPHICGPNRRTIAEFQKLQMLCLGKRWEQIKKNISHFFSQNAAIVVQCTRTCTTPPENF